MDAYIGVDGVARRIVGMWIGVDGVAREITSAYIGVDGVARQFYSLSTPKEIIKSGACSLTSWYARFHTYSSTAGSGTVKTASPSTAQTSNIRSTYELTSGGCILYCVSADKISLSGYKYAYVEIYSTCNFGVHFVLSSDNTSNTYSNYVKRWGTKAVNEISGSTTYYNRMAFDISSYSDSYYLKLGLGATGSSAEETMYIKQLVLTNDLSDYDYYILNS